MKFRGYIDRTYFGRFRSRNNTCILWGLRYLNRACFGLFGASSPVVEARVWNRCVPTLRDRALEPGPSEDPLFARGP